MKKRIYSVLFAGLVLLAFTPSCKKDSDTVQNTGLAQQEIWDVPYGSDSTQVMDIYLPANRSAEKTKTLIMIHGGAWTAGDKV